MKAFIADVDSIKNKTRKELEKMGIEIMRSAVEPYEEVIYVKDRKSKDYYMISIKV